MNIHQEFAVNTIDTKLEKFSSELYMEGLILLNPKLLSLNDIDFSNPTIITNQLVLSSGERIDLLVKYEDFIGVVELKKLKIDDKVLEQLQRYLLKYDEILKNKKVLDTFYKAEKVEPNGLFAILTGNSIKPETLVKIEKHNNENGIKIFVVIIKKYSTKNDQFFITSNCINYDEGLLKNRNNKIKGKDFTKYEYEGQKFGKGRLVLAVITDYIYIIAT